MPSLTSQAAVTDLDPGNQRDVEAAARLLALSVHDSLRGLVPYHASGYAHYLRTALEPPAPLRTVLIRLIFVDGEPVGVADWRVLSGSLFLNGIAVSEHARGRGLAGQLIADGQAIADGLGLSGLGLDVVTENSVAMSLYRRLGFVATGESYWYDVAVPPNTSTGLPARALDWPAFRAHLAAFGFGDLTIRTSHSDRERIRLVGDKLRVDRAQSCLAAVPYLQSLGACRIFTTRSHPGADAHFSRSARMVRE